VERRGSHNGPFAGRLQLMGNGAYVSHRSLNRLHASNGQAIKCHRIPQGEEMHEPPSADCGQEPDCTYPRHDLARSHASSGWAGGGAGGEITSQMHGRSGTVLVGHSDIGGVSHSISTAPPPLKHLRFQPLRWYYYHNGRLSQYLPLSSILVYRASPYGDFRRYR